MKPIRFDRHAKKRMKDRKVSQEEVESAINNPDFSESSIKERTNMFKFVSGRYLRATCKEESDHLLVITVAIRKKPFRRQHEDRVQQGC
jgi:hypothetical protein